MHHRDITAIVLCGGSAARLGAVDKTLIPVAGRPLVAHTIEALRPQVGAFVLACGRNPAAYEGLGLPAVADRQPGNGPLAGIVSALPLVSTEWVLVHPGDTPFAHASLVDRLAPDAERDGLAVPRAGGQRQHLVMLLGRGRAARLVEYHARGGRAVRAWLDEVGAIAVDMTDASDSFLNVNTPADLAAVERRLTETV